MKRGGAQRGQAVVELALTSVMFVTVLLFGIYFAEVGFVGQKVQEAAAYAMYDASGRRVTDFDNQKLVGNFNAVYQPFTSLNGYLGTGGDTMKLYSDFDGVLSGSNTMAQVMTSATGMNVSCVADNRMSFAIGQINSARWEAPRVQAYLRNLYRNQGGLRCTASATVNAINFPRVFLDTAGPVTKEQLFDRDPLRICGAGKNRNGQCNGAYAVLTGDWALDQARPTGQNLTGNHSLQDGMGNPVGAQRNAAFRKIASDIFVKNGDSKQSPGNGITPAQEMINIGGGYPLGQVRAQPEWNDRKFLMSYAGEEDNFTQPLAGTVDTDNPSQDTRYNTSGVFIKQWANPSQRNGAIIKLKRDYKDCFLGIAREGCSG